MKNIISRLTNHFIHQFLARWFLAVSRNQIHYKKKKKCHIWECLNSYVLDPKGKSENIFQKLGD